MKKVNIVPATFANGCYHVGITINRMYTVPALLNTGSRISMLDRKVLVSVGYDLLKIKPERSFEYRDLAMGTIKLNAYKVGYIGIGGKELSEVLIYTSVERDISNTLGTDILSKFDIYISHTKRRIAVAPIGEAATQ